MTSPTTPAGLRYAGLDGLRGVAVVSVFAYHAFPNVIRGGWIGVDCFFVISGFVITNLIITEQSATAARPFYNFYMRRLLRLAPALVLLIVITYPVSLAVRTESPVRSTGDALAALTYTMDLYAQRFPSGGLFAHTWSLSVEEQFYLLWPLAIYLVRSTHRRLALVAGICGVSVALIWGSAQLAVPLEALYRAPYTHTPMLVLGSALAVLKQRRWLRSISCTPAALVATALGTLMLIVLRHDASFTYPLGLLLVSGTVIVVLAHLVTWADSPIQRVLKSSVLQWTGTRSYGIYLWQWPALSLTTLLLPNSPPVSTTAAAIITLAASSLSWRYLERPFLRLGTRFRSAKV